MQYHINKSYILTSLKYFILTKCIMLCIYNYFAIKLLFCQTLICEVKHLKFSVVPHYPPGLNMMLVCNCTTKP